MFKKMIDGVLLPFILQKDLDEMDRHKLSEKINEALDNSEYWCDDVEFWEKYLSKYYQERTGFIFVRTQSHTEWVTIPF
jgi:hypothetical protein